MRSAGVSPRRADKLRGTCVPRLRPILRSAPSQSAKRNVRYQTARFPRTALFIPNRPTIDARREVVYQRGERRATNADRELASRTGTDRNPETPPMTTPSAHPGGSAFHV